MSTVKRPRNSRVATYLLPAEYRSFRAYMKRHKCDASHIVRTAVLGLLVGGKATGTLAKIEEASDCDALRQIVCQGTALFQAVNWSPITVRKDKSLALHFDASLASHALEELRPEMNLLVRRVAHLIVQLEGAAAAQPKTKNADASLAKPKGEKSPCL